jgi:hypothetical protein
MPKSITLYRPASQANRYFRYSVETADGKTLGSIGNNEKLQLAVSDGVTAIQVKLRWCGSRLLDVHNIPDGAQVSVKANRFLNLWMPVSAAPLFMVAQLLANAYTGLKNPMLALFIAALSGLISTLTVFRHAWIYLEVEK